MGALGCVIPFVLTIVGAGIGGMWGGSHGGIWGAVAGLMIGIVAMFAAWWGFERARNRMVE
jgi:O-antigen/teichoic acid export membrane protein